MISKKLSIELLGNNNLSTIKEAYVAVAMISDNAFDIYCRNINPTAKQRVLVGLNLPTSPTVLEKLLRSSSDLCETKIYTKSFFHPKMYLFRKQSDDWLAYIGSGNFTLGGFYKNIELFAKITDQEFCQSLFTWFHNLYSDGIPLSDSLLDRYKSIYPAKKARMAEDERESTKLLEILSNESRFNLNSVDFSGQFFSLKNHLCLSFENSPRTDLQINGLRRDLRDRLYDLNQLLDPHLHEIGDIHPHYVHDHIVASIIPQNHHGHKIEGLWLAYGRSENSIKNYGESETPINFIRMQVIVFFDSIGIWLMPGKKQGSPFDRDYFKNKMESDSTFRSTFFEQLRGLGDDYIINIAEEKRCVTDFENPTQLWEFTKQDDWRYYYFIIGRDYKLGSTEFLEQNAVNTVISEFKNLYSLYKLIKHPSY